MDAVITITKSDLQQALVKWDAEAKAGNWKPGDDADKARSAEYLFGLLTGN